VNSSTTPVPRSAGKSKIAKAREKKREATTPQAVAAAVAATVKPAKPAAVKPRVKNILLPPRVVALGDRRIADFSEESGRGLSWSALTEVALLELLGRDDFNAVIERHGARARRPDVK
jgi:hypothetical protein